MWCGTCHDPHQEPAQSVAYYREKCLHCHVRTSFAADHPSRTSNCIGCHMPKRAPNDGGHTAFTDHRIQRQPQSAADNDTDNPPPDSLAPWRQPPSELAARNLGIASVDVGLEKRSPKLIVGGYRMLTEVQQQFPQDSELFNTMGLALFAGQQYGEAVQAFELAVRFDPQSSLKEASLGQAYLALGEHGLAEQHLERAMELDSLNLSAAAILISAYNQNGEAAKAEQLSRKIAHLVENDLKTR
jgi:tetratricopeptide (TPR) repeat protein